MLSGQFYTWIEPICIAALGISLLMALGCLQKLSAEIPSGPELERFEDAHPKLPPMSQLLKIVVAYPHLLTRRGILLRRWLYAWAILFITVFASYGAVSLLLAA